MRFLSFTLAVFTVVASASATRADFDVMPYALGGKIVTGGHDDVLGTDNISQQVYSYSFGADPADPYIIGDPGFNNGTFGVGLYPNNGLLPTFSTLGFDILTNLRYWDGTGSVSFSAAPAGVDLGITRGSTTVHIDGVGQIGPAPTIGSTGAAGRLHVHVQSTLNSADGFNPALPNAPDGLYLLGLKLTLPGSGIKDSDPIYFIYNSNATDAADAAAMDWVQANLVPEPTTWVLMATALGTLLAVARRRKRST